MKKPNHDRIYLLPEDGVWCWADRPAPGVGQSNDDAVEYVRADLFDQVAAQRDSATSQLETARTAINNNFNQLREHADKMQAERDNAWQELREIREAIGANPEESTADEVRRVNAHSADLVNIITKERDFLLTKLDENESQKLEISQLKLKAADRDKLQDELIDMMNQRDAVVAQLAAIQAKAAESGTWLRDSNVNGGKRQSEVK